MLPKVDYSSKKFLVIDDFPEFRSSIKRMVESFGGVNIDMSPNGEDATEKMLKTKYDIVLSDYNLGGDGKDGQQVLEEAKFRKLLKNSTIYIMLTAESTIKMVMGALEYEPDGYLTKPFNKEMLLNRLEKIAERKELLLDIYKAIDREQYDKAVLLCNDQIKKRSKAMIECLKIKAKLKLEAAEYTTAQKVYQQVLAVRQLPWAMMGVGKCLYYLGDYYEASDQFQELIDENNMCVEAYDWLARCKDKLGDPGDAQRILEEAVKLSPKAILRQQELGKYAKENEDFAVAEKALRTAVKLGKFSCYRDADNSLDLAGVLLDKCTPDAGIKGKRAGNEALQVLTDLTRSNPDDKAIAVKAAMLESTAYKGLRQDGESKKALQKAEKVFRDLGDSPPLDIALAMGNSYVKLGEMDKAGDVARDIIQEHFENEQYEDEIKALCEAAGISGETDAMIKEEKEKLDNLNKEGVKLFQEGKLDEAVKLFEQAAEEMPGNLSVSLNAAQALIQYMQEHGKDSKMLNRSRKYLDRVRDIDKEDSRYQRYRELLKLHREVARS